MSAFAAASEVDVGVADVEFAGRCSHADVSFAKSELAAAPVTVTGSVSAAGDEGGCACSCSRRDIDDDEAPLPLPLPPPGEGEDDATPM